MKKVCENVAHRLNNISERADHLSKDLGNLRQKQKSHTHTGSVQNIYIRN